MKNATNREETLENFKELVHKMQTLLDEFHETQYKIDDKYVEFIVDITDDENLSRLTEKGFPEWEKSKDNLIELKGHQKKMGLIHLNDDYCSVAESPKYFPIDFKTKNPYSASS